MEEYYFRVLKMMKLAILSIIIVHVLTLNMELKNYVYTFISSTNNYFYINCGEK